MINYGEIEEKWQKAWAEARLFEGDINGKKPFMVTAAFPYPNAPQHIGHLRTYGTADALARYKRMLGYNVLYPMAFHATGTPILAFAKRIKNNDKDLMHELGDLFHVPAQDIAKMTDPLFIANYFITELERGMRYAGYSIDWRRKFISIEPKFSKFVEWQFGILNKKGYLKKGKHPVGWCTNENNAVGMHDTKKDVEPEIGKVIVIRFRVESLGAYALCATFRPETIHGVTNIFINGRAKYAVCRIGDDEFSYIVSVESAKSLALQVKVAVVKEIEGRELLGAECINPATGSAVPIFDGFFVEEGRGTGLVMSVPAHAPFDYVALQRLASTDKRAGEIKPIKVIELKGGAGGTVGEVPSLEYLKALDPSGNYGNDTIERATELEYKEESHKGVMAIDPYRGMKEAEAREKIGAMLKEKGDAFDIYMMMNESAVYCRCGTPVVVRVVDDQWFIDYGNEEWKAGARKALARANVLPASSRNAFSSAIEWIGMRAVARAQGLGTKFPLDSSKIIESLSDSSMYMPFYTIANMIRDLDEKQLTPEFFDFVILGVGKREEVSKRTGIGEMVLKKCAESFEYWYTNTSRHSGPDLIFNHLTMFLFNHVAALPEGKWPGQIVVNGVVLSDGEKMSKSIGNITPLIDGIAKFGADPLRAVVVAGAELMSDSDYSEEALGGVKERFEYLYGLIRELDSADTGELMQIDYWLYSKLNRKIDAVTSAMDLLELRDAITKVLYDSIIEIKQYKARGGRNKIVLKDFLSAVSLMLQPVAPHISEEFWHLLGNESFASTERWPVADKGMISEKVEASEKMVSDTISDAKSVIDLFMKKGGKKPSRIAIVVADEWKREASRALAEEKDYGRAMERLKKIEGIKIEDAARYLGMLSKKTPKASAPWLSQEEEFHVYSEALGYISASLGVHVALEKENESRSERAGRSMPMKPGIDIS